MCDCFALAGLPRVELFLGSGYSKKNDAPPHESSQNDSKSAVALASRPTGVGSIVIMPRRKQKKAAVACYREPKRLPLLSVRTCSGADATFQE